MLRNLIETYLENSGFHRTTHENGTEYWGHPELGEGRRFEDAVVWQMGREVEEPALCR